jgi:hypothetical protein
MMKSWKMVSLSFLLMGCGDPTPHNDGVDVQAPGVRVKVDDDKVKVQAPGVQVDSKKDDKK